MCLLFNKRREMLLFNIINESYFLEHWDFCSLSLRWFFLSSLSQISMLNLLIALNNNSALKSFSCWLVPSALFSLMSFPFFLVPAWFGLSRPIPNPIPHPFQAICVQQCSLFWQFTPGAVGEITRDDLWLAGKTHLTNGLFHLLALTHPSCSLAAPAHLAKVSSRLPRQVSVLYFYYVGILEDLTAVCHRWAQLLTQFFSLGLASHLL